MIVADSADSQVGTHSVATLVHPIYAKYKTSGLTREVTAEGANSITLKLDPASPKKMGW